MASAAAKISFTCPHCDKVLKMSARPAEGKKIKCPSCGEAFVPEIDDDEADLQSVQERPTLKSKGKKKSDPDAKPPGKKSKSRDDDDDDEDEDEDEDDRPSRKKKKAKQKGGSMIMIVLLLLLGGGFLVSLALVAVGLFVWPGWLKSRPTEQQVAQDGKKDPPQMPNGGGNENPPPAGAPGTKLTLYTLPDAPILAGVEPKLMRDKGQFEPALKQIEGFLPLPPEIKEFLRNADSMMVSVEVPANPGLPGQEKMIVGILGSGPDLVAKFKLRAGQEQKLGNKYSSYRMPQAGNTLPLAVIPNDRVILLTNVSEAEMLGVLERAAANQPPQSAAIKMSETVNLSHAWVAVGLNAAMRKEMQFNELALVAPQAGPAVQALQRMNGLSIAVNSMDTFLKITTYIDCASPADAQQITKTGDDLKNTLKTLLDGPQGKGLPVRAKQDLESLTFRDQGNMATADILIDLQTVTDVAKMAMLGQPKMPGKDFGPKDLAKNDGIRDFGPKDFPKFDGGPKDFPKFDGGPKDFPKFDGMKKDFPKFDGGPKDKGVPGTNSFTLPRLTNGLKEEKLYNFQAGKRVTITMTSTVTLKTTNVDLFVLQGNTGEKIIQQDITAGPNGNISFVVPVSGVYRIRVLNRGPGTATNCVVTIREQ